MRFKKLFLACVLLISLAWEQNCKASENLLDLGMSEKQQIVPASQVSDIENHPPVPVKINEQALPYAVNNIKEIKKAQRYVGAGVFLISGALMLYYYSPTDPFTLSPYTRYDPKELLRLMNGQLYFYENSLFQGMMTCVEGMMACAGGLSCLKSVSTFWKVDTARKPIPWRTERTFATLRYAADLRNSLTSYFLPSSPPELRISVASYFLPSLSPEHREIEETRNKYSKKFTIDLQNTPINIWDLARFSLYPNLHTLILRNSKLTDAHIETVSILGLNVKKLDIRDNPDITQEEMQYLIRFTLCNGFRQLEELIFDARSDIFIDYEILLKLNLPKHRKLKIYGSLVDKKLLAEALQHKFTYFNSSKHPQDLKFQPSSDSLNVFYYDQNKILFTPQGVYLPIKFSGPEYASLRMYLNSRRETYKKATNLMDGEEKDITSFMEIKDLQNEWSPLASKFRYAQTNDDVHYGDLIETSNIEALIRYNFLPYVKIVVTE